MTGAQFEIVSINVGKPVAVEHKGRNFMTGIYKQPAKEPIFLSSLNLDGDAQADLVHHGGRDKAVCVYCYDHYAHWEKELGRPLACGAFGENLTVRGLREEVVCIGDVFQLGEAVVQVSQPRQPCFKLAIKYDLPDLPVRLQNTGFTGFYFRVLKEGWVSKDHPLQLLEPHPMRVTVAWANRIMHHEKQNAGGIRRILEVDALSSSWRRTLSARLEGKATDETARLTGEVETGESG